MPRSLLTPPTLADFAASPPGAVDADMWYDTTRQRIEVEERGGIENDLVSGWGFDPRAATETRSILLGANSVKDSTAPIDANLQSVSVPSTLMHAAPVVLDAGDVITNLAAVATVTATAAITNQWFALYDAAGNLLRQTPDLPVTAWPANTCRVRALTSPYTVPARGLFYLAFYYASGTSGTFLCAPSSQFGGVAVSSIPALFPNFATWRAGAVAATPTAPASISALGTTNSTRVWMAAT